MNQSEGCSYLGDGPTIDMILISGFMGDEMRAGISNHVCSFMHEYIAAGLHRLGGSSFD